MNGFAGGDPLDVFDTAWATIGKLTTFWAKLESRLFQEFRIYVSGDEYDGNEVTYILANGLRWGDMTKAFRQVLAAKGASDDARDILADILAEAVKVKSIRDLAAHNDFHLAGDGRTVVFHLWGKSPAASYHACYAIEELDVCADHAFRLASRVDLELGAALRGQPIPDDDDMLRSLRVKPVIARPPADDPERDSRAYLGHAPPSAA